MSVGDFFGNEYKYTGYNPFSPWYTPPTTLVVSGELENTLFIKELSKPKVVFDGDYTIYYNAQGRKTVVKRMKGEEYDQEKAVMYAILKSMGVKPKEIQDLIDNSVDNRRKRTLKMLKKMEAKERKLSSNK